MLNNNIGKTIISALSCNHNILACTVTTLSFIGHARLVHVVVAYCVTLTNYDTWFIVVVNILLICYYGDDIIVKCKIGIVPSLASCN